MVSITYSNFTIEVCDVQYDGGWIRTGVLTVQRKIIISHTELTG